VVKVTGSSDGSNPCEVNWENDRTKSELSDDHGLARTIRKETRGNSTEGVKSPTDIRKSVQGRLHQEKRMVPYK
jgi:hypothetical protein